LTTDVYLTVFNHDTLRPVAVGLYMHSRAWSRNRVRWKVIFTGDWKRSSSSFISIIIVIIIISIRNFAV